jgi:hypothetical protein
LKSTIRLLLFAIERHLWDPGIELIDNLAIDDLAHLIILPDGETALVARPIESLRHQRATRCVGLTQIAVYSAPALFAFT